MKSLIEPEELQRRLGDERSHPIVLAVASFIDYRTGHIPGALRIWRNDYESSDYPYEGMLCAAHQFEDLAQRLGINDDSEIVLYDHRLDATHVWWAFTRYGKSNVKILNGGFRAWKMKGFEIQIKVPPKPKRGTFLAKETQAATADRDLVASVPSSSELQLWDTREEDEWNGSKQLRGAFGKGRIPGAKLLNWKEFKDTDTERFLSNEGLQALVQRYNIDPSKGQIFYCQSGVRSTQPLFALHLLGWPLEKLLNYDGSWVEWSYYLKHD